MASFFLSIFRKSRRPLGFCFVSLKYLAAALSAADSCARLCLRKTCLAIFCPLPSSAVAASPFPVRTIAVALKIELIMATFDALRTTSDVRVRWPPAIWPIS